MRRYTFNGFFYGVGLVAGPWIFARMCNHLGANRVELDVAHAGKKVVVAIDKAGFMSPFIHRAMVCVAVQPLPLLKAQLV